MRTTGLLVKLRSMEPLRRAARPDSEVLFSFGQLGRELGFDALVNLSHILDAALLVPQAKASPAMECIGRSNWASYRTRDPRCDGHFANSAQESNTSQKFRDLYSAPALQCVLFRQLGC